MDTSGLIYLSESYTWRRPAWKAVESLERGVFVAAVLVSQQLGPASMQLLVGALVLVVFQVKAFEDGMKLTGRGGRGCALPSALASGCVPPMGSLFSDHDVILQA